MGDGFVVAAFSGCKDLGLRLVAIIWRASMP